MDKVVVNIQNCYGIHCLESEFDFSGGKSTYAIYAPNGVMKTSFANVFDDYYKDKPSMDLIYPERVSVRKITDSKGDVYPKEAIFVIKPFDKNFKTEKISTLLVKEELRKKYDEIMRAIDSSKDSLIAELKKNSGYKGNIQEVISIAFTGAKDNFFVALERLEKEITSSEDYSFFCGISYSMIFDEKIVAFLETGDIKTQIIEYIKKYDELLNDSKILKKNFNHYHATTIHKNLKDNNFFKADHTVNLAVDGKKEEILNEKDFLTKIQDEKERIINNSELKKIFEAIDKKISNQQLREFREYLFENQDLLPELANLTNLRQKIWLGQMKNCQLIYNQLLDQYRKGQKEINNIVEQAKKEETRWEKVINIFNARFFVPFKLGIKNKEEAILKETAPSIHYYFENKEEAIDEELLFKVLSQGERRAFYLLNIIFEIESRRAQRIKTLLVVDDIADSFDYKNKYAIIEYLKELSSDNLFNSIILTHNFDFYRTVQERIGMSKYEKSFMAIKDVDKTQLINLKYKYISNPFKEWKGDLQDNAKLIASISFARNIAEYIGDNECFKQLTSLLHIKPDTNDYTIAQIENIYRSIFKDLNLIDLKNKEKNMLELIFEVAEKIYQEPVEIGLNLENKIVLSIAIRLYAEKFMITKINDEDYVVKIKSSQTGKLFGRFKKDFSRELENINILEKVNIMTPENIHLNSFMFEPILDISDCHLKELYNQTKLMMNQLKEDSCITVA